MSNLTNLPYTLNKTNTGNYNNSTRASSTIKYIVVHYTGNKMIQLPATETTLRIMLLALQHIILSMIKNVYSLLKIITLHIIAKAEE